MSTVTMTMQEALAKKKILEDNISKRLGFSAKSAFVAYATDVDKTIGGHEISDATELMRSAFVSLQHLISNLSNLKIAINASNAKTKITVAGKEYTVADAIARYRSLDTEKGFYNACANQYSNVTKSIEQINARVNDPDNVADYVNKILGSDSAKRNESLYNSIVDDYKQKNLVHIIDPNDLTHTLESWNDDLTSFEAEIHTALVTSNVQTTITVEFED